MGKKRQWILINPLLFLTNSRLVGKEKEAAEFMPLLRANGEGKQMLELLIALSYELAIKHSNYNLAKLSGVHQAELLRLAEWDFLRHQQIDVIKNRLTPAASLRRDYDEDKQVFQLKVEWEECGSNKTKTIKPSPHHQKNLTQISNLLEECLNRGDTLKQILYAATMGERLFSEIPEEGKIPLWVKEWEESGYSLEYMPPSFAKWANIQDA